MPGLGEADQRTVNLRVSEWALLAFFSYIALISLVFLSRSEQHWVPFLIGGVSAGVILLFAYAESRLWPYFFSIVRDWVTLGLVLTCYREMDWFTPKHLDHRLENSWIVWDHLLLDRWGLRRAIESAGPWIPGLLELTYLLVYVVGPVMVGLFYFYERHERTDAALLVYVAGTVGAYALFPYFPSGPPRAVFQGMDLPNITTPIRDLNLYLVGGYGIHSSVFPSAHVSSAFSAAWALFLFAPDKKSLGWSMLVYALLVSIATVYGRYHFAVDALAGFGVSVIAALTVRALAGSRLPSENARD